MISNKGVLTNKSFGYVRVQAVKAPKPEIQGDTACRAPNSYCVFLYMYLQVRGGWGVPV